MSWGTSNRNAVAIGLGGIISLSSGQQTVIPLIGEAYEGGYFAGQFNDNGTIYNLVVSPRATGRITGQWMPVITDTTATSNTDGMSNTIIMADAGSVIAQAVRALAIGGKTDWYIPTFYELEVLYYFFKTTTGVNNTSAGSNPYAVAPEPVSTSYTSGSPAQTSVVTFKFGGAETFPTDVVFSSNQCSTNAALGRDFTNGQERCVSQLGTYTVRAIRRVLA